MACRIGMSTTPLTRIAYWKRKEGHTYSKILARGLTFKQASNREKREAEARGCNHYQGGKDNGRSNWSVYYVSGGKIY